MYDEECLVIIKWQLISLIYFSHYLIFCLSSILLCLFGFLDTKEAYFIVLFYINK